MRQSNIFSTLTLFALFMVWMVIGWNVSAARAHGSPDNCSHNRPDHPHCTATGGDGGEEGPARARMQINSGEIQADGNGTCAESAGFAYWHSNPGQGPHDNNCDPSGPSQRVNNAFLACGWCFNTVGALRPHDPSNWDDTNRYMVFNWPAGSGIDIDQDIYDTNLDTNCVDDCATLWVPPVAAAADSVDNLEVIFNITENLFNAFVTVPNFEIDILAPRIKRNGDLVWETKYTLLYPDGVTITPLGPYLADITSNGSAILTKLHDNTHWTGLNMPFSLTVRGVFKDASGGCCQEDPPS